MPFNYLKTPSHALAEELMKATDYIDVLIPRGGARLIQTVKDKAKVPVIETGVGNVHIYIDQSADLDMATEIVINAKTQRPSVCNAAEGLVIHESIAEKFIVQLETEIVKVHSVEFRVDQKALSLFKNAKLAKEEDYASEFLDYIMSVKIVSSFRMKLLTGLIITVVIILSQLLLRIWNQPSSSKNSLMLQLSMSMHRLALLTVL